MAEVTHPTPNAAILSHRGDKEIQNRRDQEKALMAAGNPGLAATMVPNPVPDVMLPGTMSSLVEMAGVCRHLVETALLPVMRHPARMGKHRPTSRALLLPVAMGRNRHPRTM